MTHTDVYGAIDQLRWDKKRCFLKILNDSFHNGKIELWQQES